MDRTHPAATTRTTARQRHPHVRTQTIDQDVHISPDDSNAVLDSGAMMTTESRRLLLTNPEWEDSIRPAPPGTAIRYGNMETEPVEEVSTIGSYQLSIVPNRYHTALVCVHDIVSAGHVVTFTNTETIVSDVGGATHSAYPASQPPGNGAYHSIYYSASPTCMQATRYITPSPTTIQLDNYHPVQDDPTAHDSTKPPAAQSLA